VSRPVDPAGQPPPKLTRTRLVMARKSAVALRFVCLCALAATLGLLSGCQNPAPFVDSDQVGREPGRAVALAPGHSAGQTFVARHAGLAAVEVWLQPDNSLPVTVTLVLRADSPSGEEVAAAPVVLAPAADPGFYRFGFSPIHTSHSQSYYAHLEASGEGVGLALTGGEAYLDGAAYQNGQPLDAQATFRLVYAWGPLVGDLLWAAVQGLGLLAAAALLWIVPGWALVERLWPEAGLCWAERLGLAAGAGLAVYPVLVLWTHVVGLHLGAWLVWLVVGGSLLALLWWHRSWRPRHGADTLRAWARSEQVWPDLALLGLLAMVFGVRLLVARGLETPLWGDGYQHTMIAQLIVDHGGLFRSWAPYAELENFTYHFGFHGAVAALHWLTGLPVIASTIWTGQLLNGLAVLALYPLAVRVTGSRWGGVWAVLLAGLLSPMPMFYVNWGRYTQLAGLAILPAAVVFAWEAVERPRRRWALLALAGVTVGGLALTHYRVVIFYAAFVAVLALVYVRSTGLKALAARFGAASLLAALLFLPWFANSFAGNTPQFYGKQLATPPSQAHPFMAEYNAIGPLTSYFGGVGWLAMLSGLGVGLWNRQRGVLLCGLWGGLLLFLANPAWLGLPGTGVVNNFSVVISVYVLAGLLCGALLVAAICPAERKGWRWLGPALAVGCVAAGLWGARDRMGDLDLRGHAPVTRPDVAAAAWIGENTPEGACFLVNSFPAYGGGAVVGSDAGWWLPLLAERSNTVPPLSYVNEVPPESGVVLRVERLARLVQEVVPAQPEMAQALRREGVSHVYIGQRQGRVNYAGPDVLNPQAFLESPDYRAVYHQDRVWVFEIQP
jgi:hypothetical protein